MTPAATLTQMRSESKPCLLTIAAVRNESADRLTLVIYTNAREVTIESPTGSFERRHVPLHGERALVQTLRVRPDPSVAVLAVGDATCGSVTFAENPAKGAGGNGAIWWTSATSLAAVVVALVVGWRSGSAARRTARAAERHAAAVAENASAARKATELAEHHASTAAHDERAKCTASARALLTVTRQPDAKLWESYSQWLANLRMPPSAPEWMAFGDAARRIHETWAGLEAFTPQDLAIVRKEIRAVLKLAPGKDAALGGPADGLRP